MMKSTLTITAGFQGASIVVGTQKLWKFQIIILSAPLHFFRPSLKLTTQLQPMVGNGLLILRICPTHLLQYQPIQSTTLVGDSVYLGNSNHLLNEMPLQRHCPDSDP